MEFRRVALTDVKVGPLLASLAREYAERYGATSSAGEMAATQPEQFDPPEGAFLILVDDDTSDDTNDDIIVAGGGIRSAGDGICEVKRMWTAPEYRRRGHASTILIALEDVARDLGYDNIQAVTGPGQPEACALYARHGYSRAVYLGAYQGAIAFERNLA